MSRNPRQALQKELNSLPEPSPKQLEALLELSCTANQTGLTEIAITDVSTAKFLIDLVRLSYNYKLVGVPPELRM